MCIFGIYNFSYNCLFRNVTNAIFTAFFALFVAPLIIYVSVNGCAGTSDAEVIPLNSAVPRLYSCQTSFTAFILFGFNDPMFIFILV